MNQETYPCWIYKSPLKDEMYLYLATREGFAAVPPDLLDRFGPPQFVMELELHAARKLAREDATQVMSNLVARGYHLQLPPRTQALLPPGFQPDFHADQLH